MTTTIPRTTTGPAALGDAIAAQIARKQGEEGHAPLDLSTLEGHTPGDWHLVTASRVNGYSVAASDYTPPLAHVNSTWATAAPGNVGEANARLIAAAPALLAEVRELRASLADHQGLAWDLGKREQSATQQLDAARDEIASLKGELIDGTGVTATLRADRDALARCPR